MGGQGDDPSQHDRPVPSEMPVQGALVETTAPAYWFGTVPQGTRGQVVRVEPVHGLSGWRSEATLDVDINGSPARVIVDANILRVLDTPAD